MKLINKTTLSILTMLALPLISSSNFRVPNLNHYPNKTMGSVPKTNGKGYTGVIFVHPEFGLSTAPDPQGKPGAIVIKGESKPNSPSQDASTDNTESPSQAANNNSGGGWQPGMMLWADIQGGNLLQERLKKEEYLVKLRDSAASSLHKALKKYLSDINKRISLQNLFEAFDSKPFQKETPIDPSYDSLAKARYSLLIETGLFTETVPFSSKNQIETALNKSNFGLRQDSYETSLAFAQALNKYASAENTELRTHVKKLINKEVGIRKDFFYRKESNLSLSQNKLSSQSVGSIQQAKLENEVCSTENLCKAEIYQSKDEPELSKRLVNVQNKIFQAKTKTEAASEMKSLAIVAVQYSNESLKLSYNDLTQAFLFVAEVLAEGITLLDPTASTTRDLYEALTGTDLINGESLSEVDRGFAIFGVVTAGFGSKVGNVFKAIDKLSTLVKNEVKFGKAREVAKNILGNKVFSDLSPAILASVAKTIKDSRSSTLAVDTYKALESLLSSGIRKSEDLKAFAQTTSHWSKEAWESLPKVFKELNLSHSEILSESQRLGISADDFLNRRGTAIGFYNSTDKFTGDTARIDSHLKGIDFSSPVEVVTLKKDTLVTSWSIPESNLGDYVSIGNAKPSEVGLDSVGRSRVDKQYYAKIPKQYRAIEDIKALKSKASDIIDTWSREDSKIYDIPDFVDPNKIIKTNGHYQPGGGTQYFIHKKTFTEIKE